MRRRGVDTGGLSLFDASRIDAQACIEQENSCHGLSTLHVGTLRDFGLSIIRDPENTLKVLVVNVPYENPGTVEEEAMLDMVADSARIQQRCRWRKPK